MSRSRVSLSLAATAILLATALVPSCSGEDRSDEMPRVPVVYTEAAEAAGDSCTMHGRITESHNSSLRECGFVYGMEGGKAVKLVADSAWLFRATADSLKSGSYYCIAYARNGMGTAYGDTVRFSISGGEEQ